jgi:sugar lactone lactonase YvrE
VDVTVSTASGTSATSAADKFAFDYSQTITFPQPVTPVLVGSAPITLTATGGGSGNPVTFSVVSGPATGSGTNGSTLSFTGVGAVVVEANQLGNSTYLPASPVQRTIFVSAPVSYMAPTTPVGATSSTQTVTISLFTTATVGSINVLTKGIANLDFKFVSGGSCAIGTSYVAGQACTVEYSFTPTSPGGRAGAIVLEDASGNVLATSSIGGVGTGPQGLFTTGVLANVASGLDLARGVSVDGAGNVYNIENNGNIDKFAAATGVETVLTTAGNSPSATAVDGAGNVYFGSDNAEAIYELVGGTGTPVEIASGWTPDNVMVADLAGNLYSSDENTGAIHMIAAGTHQASLVLPAGPISRIIGMTVDASGNLYAADFNHNAMYEIVAGSGTATELFSGNGLSNPHGLTIDPAGNLYVTNYTGGDVQKYTNVAGAWVNSSLQTGSNGTRGITIDSSGNLVMLTDATIYRDTRTTTSLGFGSEGVGSETAAQATGFENDGNAPLTISALGTTSNFTLDPSTTTCTTATGLAVAAACNVGAAFTPSASGSLAGDINITDNTLNAAGTIQQVALSGIGVPSTPVGTTSATQTATITFMNSGTIGAINVVTQGATNLDFEYVAGGTCAVGTAYIADHTCTVEYSFTPTHPWLRLGGITVVNSANTVLGQSFLTGFGSGSQAAFSPVAGLITKALGAGLSSINLAVDSSGNVYESDSGGANGEVKKIPVNCTSTGCVQVLGGGFNYPTGVAVDGIGNVYFANSGNGLVKEMPANCTSASCVATIGGGFGSPYGVAVDGAGNVYVADSFSSAVTVMPPGCASSACVTKLGAGFSYPLGVAVDGSGNVYVADSNNGLVKEMPAGCASSACVTTLGAGFSYPIGVAVDGSGNVYVADNNYDTLFEMSPGCTNSNCVTVLDSAFGDLQGLALDGSGNIFTGDNYTTVVTELDVHDPPTLNFPTATKVGTTDTTDGAISVTVLNNGNMPLTATGPGLTLNTNFMQVAGTGTPADCTASFSLVTNASCNLSIEFAPTAGGPITSTSVLTDNALNGSPATQTITLSGTGVGGTPTLSFSVSNQTYGVAPFAVSATSNSTGALTYSVVSGPATISGSAVTLTGAGSVTLQASQAASAGYTAATVQASFTVNPATPAITFSVPNQYLYGPATPFPVSATSNSPEAIAYSVVSGPATISGNTVTLTGMGIVTLQASQAASADYTAAAVQASFMVSGKSQVTFASLTATKATLNVFGFGFTAPSGTLSFTDTTTGKAVVASVTLNTSTAVASLLPQTTTATGANTLPDWTTLGDVNGDGKPDLITSLFGTDSVSVQLGNGDGTFQAAKTTLIETGFGPMESHLVSLRGNGTMDMVVGSYNVNQIAVLLGNGDGTFQSPVFYTVGSVNNWTSSLITGDFNHDGNQDVAVANSGDNTVSILLGNGSGALQVQSPPISVGQSPGSIRVGDFNGDGYTDLVVANYEDGTITTLLNNQNGGFTATVLSVGSGADSSPDALAIYGSGSSLQLAVGNYNDGTVSVFNSKGDGTFGAQAIIKVGSGPDDVTFADFNGDGVQDLVVANYNDNTVSLLLGKSGGGYTLTGTFNVGDGPYSAAVADIDLDGTPDIVVSNCFGSNTGTLLSGTQISIPYTSFSLTAGDALNSVYTPDGSSEYESSTSPSITAP